uniref:Uncharacterized protein n=1 Tax=Wuchereria bancrofti TaxID=6293 RepID=A0A1I8ESM5_WUCBA
MTKRRPKNKKPTGLNRFLGNCLLNEREKLRQQYRKRQQAYNTENMVEVDKGLYEIRGGGRCKKNIDRSVTAVI